MKQDKIKGFEAYLKHNEKSAATIKKYTVAVKEFLQWKGDGQLSKDIVIAYRTCLLQNLKPQTVNGRIAALNSYFRYIGQEDLKVSYIKIQRRPFIEDSRQLTEAEYQKLLETALKRENQRLYYILMTLCSTGIRISELKYITAEAVTRGRADVNMKGKCRIILLPSDLRNRLKLYMNIRHITTGPVFCTRYGNPVDRTNILHDMKKLCRQAQVDRNKVFPHNLRHLFARKFYDIEKNLCYLADILGHSRIETTRIYVAAGVSEHYRILDKMDLVRQI